MICDIYMGMEGFNVEAAVLAVAIKINFWEVDV